MVPAGIVTLLVPVLCRVGLAGSFSESAFTAIPGSLAPQAMHSAAIVAAKRNVGHFIMLPLPPSNSGRLRVRFQPGLPLSRLKSIPIDTVLSLGTNPPILSGEPKHNPLYPRTIRVSVQFCSRSGQNCSSLSTRRPSAAWGGSSFPPSGADARRWRQPDTRTITAENTGREIVLAQQRAVAPCRAFIGGSGSNPA